MMKTKIKVDDKDNRSRSRDRGYKHEDSIIDRFNNLDLWHAKRLGGTTIELPDLIVTNNNEKIFVAAECKSTTSNSTSVHINQITRCFKIRDMFSIYDKHYIIFPFKFSQKQRIAITAKKKDGTRTRSKKMMAIRKLKEFYLLFNPEMISEIPKLVSCNYDGTFRIFTHNGASIGNTDEKNNQFKFFDNFEKMLSYMVSTKRVKRSKTT
jgi:Holliday junction resolvase